MNCLEELVEESFEVSFVEMLDCFLVLYVRLCLFQSLVYGLAVVEPLRKIYNLRTYEDVASGNRLFQLDAVQGGASAEGYISLATGKDSSGEINHHPTESQPLALVNGDSPCQADWVLNENSEFFFFDALLFFVVTVTDIRPPFFLYIEFLSVFGDDIKRIILIDARYRTDGSVHPTLVVIILDEDDLCTRL